MEQIKNSIMHVYGEKKIVLVPLQYYSSKIFIFYIFWHKDISIEKKILFFIP